MKYLRALTILLVCLFPAFANAQDKNDQLDKAYEVYDNADYEKALKLF